MAFELRDGQGSAFPNSYKTSDSHPDFKGKVKINGEEWEIALWEKPMKSGETFYSLQVKPPYAGGNTSASSNKPRPAQPQTRPVRQESGTPMQNIQGMDDDIPF